MTDCTFDLDDPSDYKRLRDLLAPALARFEQSGPPSTRLEVGSRDDVPSKVPLTLLPPKYGGPSTWTQAEKDYNEDMRKLLVGAESRPFASAAQRTAAMVDVMLRHPGIFNPDRGVADVLNEDDKVAGSSRASHFVAATDLESNKLSSSPDDGPDSFEDFGRGGGEDHSLKGTNNLDTDDMSDNDVKHKLLRIIEELDNILERRSSIQRQASGDFVQFSNSNTRDAENHYSRHLRQHVGKNNSNLASGQKAAKFTGDVAKCKTHHRRKYIQETLLNSIDIQIVLGDLIAASKGGEAAAELTEFMKASVNKTWSAQHSNAFELELVMHAEKASKRIRSLLGDRLKTPNATWETPTSTRPSSTLLQSLLSQTDLSPGPSTQTRSDTCSTEASSTPSIETPSDNRGNENPINDAEPANNGSQSPPAYTDETLHWTAVGGATTGHPHTTRTKTDVVFDLELEGGEHSRQSMQFMEHHDRDQFFERIAKVFKGKVPKSVTVTIRLQPKSNASDAADGSWRTWKYNVGKGSLGISAWAELRSNLIGLSQGTQGSCETVVVKALVYWR